VSTINRNVQRIPRWNSHVSAEANLISAQELGYQEGLEQGREEGIAAVIAALHDKGPDYWVNTMRWIESPEGRAAVDAELRRGGT
jgi:hypothetical protein